MSPVQVTVQEAHGDGFHTVLLQTTCCQSDGFFVKRPKDGTAGVESFRHFECQIARHERLGLVEHQVVQRGSYLALHLEDVAEPLGGDKPCPGACGLDDGVGHHSSTVNDVRNGVTSDVCICQQSLGRVKKADRWVLGCGGYLLDPRLARGLVDQDRIREGTSDVDTYPEQDGAGRCHSILGGLAAARSRAVASTSQVQVARSTATPYTSRARCMLTFSFRTSSTTSAGSRSNGDPYPPPPHLR